MNSPSALAIAVLNVLPSIPVVLEVVGAVEGVERERLDMEGTVEAAGATEGVVAPEAGVESLSSARRSLPCVAMRAWGVSG